MAFTRVTLAAALHTVLAVIGIASAAEGQRPMPLAEIQSNGIAQSAAAFEFPNSSQPRAKSTKTHSTDISSPEVESNPASHSVEMSPENSLPEPVMQLPTFEHMALSSNPSLQRAMYMIGAAQGNAVQAGLLPNPTVGYEGQQLGSGGLAEQHGVLIGQELVRHSKRTLNRGIACREVNAAQHAYEVQRLRVLTDVRINFYRALRAQRQIAVTSELLDISRQAHASAESLFKAQEVGKADVLQAQLEVEAATIQHENAENRQRSSWSELCAVCGISFLPPAPLDGELSALGVQIRVDEALARLQSFSPEVAVAAVNIDRARLKLQRQLVETQPDVSIAGLVNWRDNGIGGASDGGLAVSVPVPIWNRNQGAIQQARHELAAAEQALAQLQFELQQRLAPAFERYANARTQVERIRDRILPAANQTLDLTRKTYQAGEINFVALLTVQRTYNQYQLAFLDALESLRIAETEIDGLLLSGALKQ